MSEVELKEYFEMLLRERQRALELEARPLNEFRVRTEQRLEDLEAFHSNMSGRIWALGFGVPILLSLILHFWR